MITRTYINNESMLSIIAPPVTKISIPIKLPNHCILEFGYGFLGETNFKNENAKFTINIKSKYRSQEIFSYTGNPKSLNEFKHKKIYLDKFAGEKIILEFITQSFNIKDNSYKTIPVWINPILYNYKANMNPNVILISIDTLRADHLGCYGYHRNTTPNIDLLSKDSVLFENAYSTTSWTLPAHISLLTSLYTNKHKTYSLLQKIDPKIPLLSNYLRKNQYYTAAITGGGFVGYYYGFAKGFDTFKDFKAAGDLSIRDDEAELLYKLASQWLEENKNKKFFLFLHTYQPHDPYLLPSHIKKAFVNENDKWQEIFFSRLLINKDRYEISFSEQDKENIINLYDSEEYFVGPLLKKLKELNVFDNTLIIILSDHGEEFYDHHAWIHGHSLYNELTKIPLIIKFPNNLFKNTRVENPVRMIDIMPTILDYLNLNYKSTKLDGKSLLQIIRHKTSLSRTFFVDLAFDKNNYPSIIGAYTGNYKLIANIEVRSPFVEKILYDNFFVELYDLEKDPLEKNNLAKYQNYNKIINRILPNIQTYISEIKIENATEVKINPELYERLKALGYIR
jgi:arylsulfatase A-like enzyme